MEMFKELNRQERFLFPPTIDEYIPEDHLARIIDEVVETLNTEAIEKKYSHLGRKAYHPKMIIKILFYGYASGERSSRKLEHRCGTDLAYLYLCGRQTPDFRTISDFRKNHIEELRSYFRQIVLLSRGMGLGCGPAIFIDGTKIKANAAAKKTKKKDKLDELIHELDESINKVFDEADQIDELEDKKYGNTRGNEVPAELKSSLERRRRLEEAKRRLETEGLKKINLTDGDAMLMKERHGVIRPGYNAQGAVTEDGLIVAQDLVCEADDKRQMEPMVKQAKEILKEDLKQVVADAGYGIYDNLKYLKEEEKLEGYVHDFAGEMRRLLTGKPEDNRYHRFNFRYYEEGDCYICPVSNKLSFYKERQFRGQHVEVYKSKACPGCAEKEKCTKEKYRTIVVNERTKLVQEMLKRLSSTEGQALYSRRMCTVEPVYGNLKFNLGYRQFLLRGIKKVRGEYALMCIGHNLGKLSRILRNKAEATGKTLKKLIEEAAEKIKKGFKGLEITLPKLSLTAAG